MRLSRLLTSAGLLTSSVTLASCAQSSSAVAAPVKNCVPAHLRVSLGVSQGAAGTIYDPVVFTNTGPACTIFGVPSIQPVVGGVTRSRVPVGPPAHNQAMGEMPALHVLQKAKAVSVAFAVVEAGNYPANICLPKNAGAIVVTLGNFVSHAFVPLKISVCTKKASTSTRLIAPGTTGY